MSHSIPGPMFGYAQGVEPDTLPTTVMNDRQKECAAQGHGWRDACHCDGLGQICRNCGFHEHWE